MTAIVHGPNRRSWTEYDDRAARLAAAFVDGVLDCLVIGLDDDKFDQSVTAVASLVEDATTTEALVIASVKAELAGYKAPKRVIFVGEVPRAPNGKADYKSAEQHALDALA